MVEWYHKMNEDLVMGYLAPRGKKYGGTHEVLKVKSHDVHTSTSQIN